MIYNEHCQFFTASILNWIPIINRDYFKDIIIEALRFRKSKNEVIIYGFVIMPNHIHLIWHITDKVKRPDFQRDFLKFISKQFIAKWKSEKNKILEEFIVNKTDREIQIWQKHSLSIDLYSKHVFEQKLNYIHNNPLQDKWKLVESPEEYIYSSAKFYNTGKDEFGLLDNYNDL